MRHRSLIRHRLVPSIALAILIALGTGLLGSITASAVVKPKPPAVASARVTFGVQPATKGKVDKRPNYRYATTPGGALRDQVAVRNLSAAAVTFRVYATDALNIDNGGFGLLPRTRRPQDVGAWVTVGGRAADGTVTVPAKSVKVLPLSMKVPANARPGDHTGGIIVAVTSLSHNAKGTVANVELDQRIGARMFVRVSGPLHPSLTVKPLNAHYQDLLNPLGRGNTNVTYRVTNTGNINLGGQMRLSVSGVIGPTQLSVKVPDVGLLLPGGFIDVIAAVHQTWPLVRELATVTIKPLVLPGDPAAGKTTYSGTTSFWAVPWAFLVLLIVIGLALLFSRRLRRARRADATRTPVTADSQTVDGDAGASEVGINQRSAARLVASTSLALAAMIATSGTATAADVPYTDTNATAGITLCDAQGHPKTSGPVEASLATMVVGGSAAVAPYDATGRSAELFAYQPRRGVDPGNWSGRGMTGMSRYTNPKHPMVEILPRDSTLAAFVEAFPAQWDGMVQLRVFLGVPNQPTSTDAYSATTIKVTGNVWQQLGPQAGAPCNVGRAESVIRLLGLPIVAPTAKANAATGVPTGSATTSATSSSRESLATSRPTTTSTGTAQALASGGSVATTAATKSGGTNPLIWGLSVAMPLGLALLSWSFVRRRHH